MSNTNSRNTEESLSLKLKVILCCSECSCGSVYLSEHSSHLLSHCDTWQLSVGHEGQILSWWGFVELNSENHCKRETEKAFSHGVCVVVVYQGEFYSASCPSEAPFSAEDFELQSTEEYMMCVGLSEFFINSALYSYFSSGLLHVNITDDMVRIKHKDWCWCSQQQKTCLKCLLTQTQS